MSSYCFLMSKPEAWVAFYFKISVSLSLCWKSSLQFTYSLGYSSSRSYSKENKTKTIGVYQVRPSRMAFSLSRLCAQWSLRHPAPSEGSCHPSHSQRPKRHKVVGGCETDTKVEPGLVPWLCRLAQQRHCCSTHPVVAPCWNKYGFFQASYLKE